MFIVVFCPCGVGLGFFLVFPGKYRAFNFTGNMNSTQALASLFRRAGCTVRLNHDGISKPVSERRRALDMGTGKVQNFVSDWNERTLGALLLPDKPHRSCSAEEIVPNFKGTFVRSFNFAVTFKASVVPSGIVGELDVLTFSNLSLAKVDVLNEWCANQNPLMMHLARVIDVINTSTTNNRVVRGSEMSVQGLAGALIRMSGMGEREGVLIR